MDAYDLEIDNDDAHDSEVRRLNGTITDQKVTIHTLNGAITEKLEENKRQYDELKDNEFQMKEMKQRIERLEQKILEDEEQKKKEK